MALTIASSCSGSGRPRALRSVLVATMVSHPFTSTRAWRMRSAPASRSMSDQRSPPTPRGAGQRRQREAPAEAMRRDVIEKLPHLLGRPCPLVSSPDPM